MDRLCTALPAPVKLASALYTFQFFSGSMPKLDTLTDYHDIPIAIGWQGVGTEICSFSIVVRRQECRGTVYQMLGASI